MPGLTPASATTRLNSPWRSRASSVEKESPTIGATGRCALGKLFSLAGCRHDASASKARMTSLVDILDLDLFARHALRQGRRHEAVEVAVEHVSGRGRSHPGAQVLHQLVGLQHVAAD